MVSGSSHSINICPPHSPTRITKNSILKLAGAFHWPNTSRIRFWAFSYSIGEPCGRSNQLIMYFMYSPFYFEWSDRSQPLKSTRSSDEGFPTVYVETGKDCRQVHVFSPLGA